MRFSDDFIERVRAGNDIADVISGYVKLSRKGASYMGLCPFHNEKTPSFSVYPARQTYHCFGCGVSGDVFNFLMEYEKMSFQEAVSALASRAGISVPQNDVTHEQKKEASQKSILFEIQKDAAKYYVYKLYSPEGKTAREYLQKRGLTAETVKSFGLGYSGKTGRGLYEFLKKKGYSDALLKESGLFTFNEQKSVMQEKFWNRAMFPIMDINRKVIGFGGRVFGDAKPKYLNSPETKLFDKSKNLYGLYAARASRAGNIIICEGYMDVISLHQAGFTNAVASLGTALTSQQAALLHRYTKEILLMYDSDQAGVKAALRAIPLLREAGLNAKVVNLKPYKDPDELIKECGNDELSSRLEKAENGFMFEIRMLYESYDMADPQSSTDFYHEAARRLMTFSDEIQRNSYLASVSRTYGIQQEVLKRQIGKLAMKAGSRAEERTHLRDGQTGRKEKASPGEKAEKTLISWMCQRPKLREIIKKYITEDDFSDGINKIVASKLFKMYDTGDFNPVSVLNGFEESEDRTKAASVLENTVLPEKEEEINKAVREVILIVKSESLNRKLSNMDGSDMMKLQEIMEEKRKIEELKKDIYKH